MAKKKRGSRHSKRSKPNASPQPVHTPSESHKSLLKRFGVGLRTHFVRLTVAIFLPLVGYLFVYIPLRGVLVIDLQEDQKDLLKAEIVLKIKGHWH